jgi:hypothetical protein
VERYINFRVQQTLDLIDLDSMDFGFSEQSFVAFSLSIDGSSGTEVMVALEKEDKSEKDTRRQDAAK